MKRLLYAALLSLSLWILPASYVWAETVSDALTITLSYESPATCPQEERFRDALRSRLGYDPFGENGTEVRVRIIGESGGFLGSLEIQQEGGEPPRRREIRNQGAQCTPLVEALAMALAVIVDPMAGLPPSIPTETEPSLQQPDPVGSQQEDDESAFHTSHTSQPTEEEPASSAQASAPGYDLSLRPAAGVRVSLAHGPGLSMGPTLGIGLRIPRFTFALRGHIDFLVADFLSNGELDVIFITGELVACLAISRFELCAKGALGVIQARPEIGTLMTTFAGDVGSEAAVFFEFRRAIMRMVVGIGVAIPRTTVFINDIQVWIASPVAGYFGFELSYDFDLTTSSSSSHFSDWETRDDG